MKPISFHLIPQALRDKQRWVYWRYQERDGKKTKIPVQLNGDNAKSNDQNTWTDFERVKRNYNERHYAGIGFVFSADDAICGIDLDGCRNSETGWVAPWAKEIILKFNSYAEVSPSGSGVKIFCNGSLPFSCGKKLTLKEEKFDIDKEPAIEAYDRCRYFAVTGWVLKGQNTIRHAQEALDWLKATYWKEEPAVPIPDFRNADAVIDRARKYVAKIPPAVSGQGGHPATFHVACVLAIEFELSESECMAVLSEWNATCAPPWSERELAHKVRSALKQTGERGRLRNAAPKNWGSIPVKNYASVAPAPEPTILTIGQAARNYLDVLKRGEANLVTTSIPDLDHAIGGGVAFGEMIIFAGRPSQGKSAVALQCLHHWTEQGFPGIIISEEMPALMLGKRAIQYITPAPEEHWEMITGQLDGEVGIYESTRKKCFIVEQAGTTEAAIQQIESKVDNEGIRVAVVDYAQLLKSDGRGRYEQITNTSIALKKLATRTKIILLVLCQMNREIEKKEGTKKKEPRMPVMSDLKDSGQLEQDADVICFLSWPWRNDKTKPPNQYVIRIAKNRNRIIREDQVNCRFLPDRQMFLDASLEEFCEIPM